VSGLRRAEAAAAAQAGIRCQISEDKGQTRKDRWLNWKMRHVLYYLFSDICLLTPDSKDTVFFEEPNCTKIYYTTLV